MNEWIAQATGVCTVIATGFALAMLPLDFIRYWRGGSR